MSAVELHEVGPDESGMRLDRWFRQHYPALGHVQLQKLLRSGQVRVDGGRVKASSRLEAGQRVRVPPPVRQAVQSPPPARVHRPLLPSHEAFVRGLVIHMDDDVIAINKPAGLAVQGGTSTEEHLDRLLDGLRYDLDERPRLVHRLDKDTSGVMLLARTRAAAAALGRSLKARSARKLYWALVNGVPRIEVGQITLALIKRGGRGEERVQVCEGDAPGAQTAISRYQLMERAGTKLSWLAMSPVTGRTHQLRVHCAAIGHPIVGDGKYGGAQAHPGGAIGRKLHLHARRIIIAHPRSGLLDVQAGLPGHMRESWMLLGLDPDDQRLPDFE